MYLTLKDISIQCLFFFDGKIKKRERIKNYTTGTDISIISPMTKREIISCKIYTDILECFIFFYLWPIIAGHTVWVFLFVESREVAYNCLHPLTLNSSE